MDSLTSHRVIYKQGLWDGAYGLSSLSEKTRESNHLQMSEQRQHFLLSYLKTLSVGPAGVWTHDLPHGSPVVYQVSQPVGGRLNKGYCTLIAETESTSKELLSRKITGQRSKTRMIEQSTLAKYNVYLHVFSRMSTRIN